VNIPILSRLLKKPKTVANISAKRDIETRMEGNKLHFEIDNLKMRGLLAQIINKAIDGEDKVADVVAQQLRAEDIAFSRKDGESLFTLDLNPMVQKYVDKGLTLEDVKVSETGRVEVVYDYQQKLQ
jgi:ribosome biogenesis SPOUT family RNA methylase Rps3